MCCLTSFLFTRVSATKADPYSPLFLPRNCLRQRISQKPLRDERTRGIPSFREIVQHIWLFIPYQRRFVLSSFTIISLNPLDLTDSEFTKEQNQSVSSSIGSLDPWNKETWIVAPWDIIGSGSSLSFERTLRPKFMLIEFLDSRPFPVFIGVFLLRFGDIKLK